MMQPQLDTRAIEIATKANTRVDHTDKSLEKLVTRIEKHEDHDAHRFETMNTKITDGFSGVYNRLWGFLILILCGVGAIAMMLGNTLLTLAGG